MKNGLKHYQDKVYTGRLKMKFTARTALLLAVILIFVSALPSNTVIAASYPPAGGPPSDSSAKYEKALDLKILGLIANSPEDFNLDQSPDRLQGAIMLVRLLGKEKIAREKYFSHPFTDVPSWADLYVGYLYQNNLTKGIGNSQFGSDETLTAIQFITFVLRSAGYEDKTDFEYSKASDKALQLGLLNTDEYNAFKKSSSFKRDDMFAISYNALSIKLKGADLTLLDKLVNLDNAIKKPAARALGLYTSDLSQELGNVKSYACVTTQYGSAVKNKENFFKLIRKSLYYYEGQIKIDIGSYEGSITDDFEAAFYRALAAAEEVTGVDDFVNSWRYSANGRTFTLNIQYRYSKNEFLRRTANARAAVDKARQIVVRLIKPDMSEFEKEIALHDYIVNNTRYDYQNYLSDTLPDESFEEYGCLVLGVAVCEGYSEAMKLLCDLAGLECIIVKGKSKRGNGSVGHAWNLIMVDGEYYHLDVTNDDPVTANGYDALAYYYFNLPDWEMSLSNEWDASEYPSCTSTENSYYYKNRLVADNREDFGEAVQRALEQRKEMIELKVTDYSEDRYSNISDILFELGNVRKYSYSVLKELGIIRIFNIQYS